MDVFMEQVVKKTPTSRDKMLEILVKISAFALAFALCFASIAFFPYIAPLALFLGFGAVWLSFRLSKKLQIEYEYAFTNGELDVDKIVAKSKRRRLCSVHIGTVSAFGKWNDDMEVEADSTMVIASDNSGKMDEYYIDFKYKDYGDTTLFFSPNAKMLELIVPYLPREIKREFQKTYKPAAKADDDE
jgi:hypothetical protein